MLKTTRLLKTTLVEKNFVQAFFSHREKPNASGEKSGEAFFSHREKPNGEKSGGFEYSPTASIGPT